MKTIECSVIEIEGARYVLIVSGWRGALVAVAS